MLYNVAVVVKIRSILMVITMSNFSAFALVLSAVRVQCAV